MESIQLASFISPPETQVHEDILMNLH